MQATLPFDAPRADARWAGFDGTGFEIGWDHAHYRVTPPVEHLQPGNPLRQGWEAGQAVFGPRTLRATPPARKWLQLRLNAWLRGRAFEGVQVTPSFLRRIEVSHCPITREPLTHATGRPSDASVDRVCNRAGYAAGNLAVMSTRANRAKAATDWDDALAFVRRIEAGRLGQIDGLDAEQWARLAVLMSFTTPLAHAQAATLPLLVLPPARLRLLNPVQALQAMLTLQFARDGYTRRIAALVALLPDAEARHELRSFMHTLLARRIAAGRLDEPLALRHALEDLWRDPLVLRRWQRLALRLDAAGCERVVRAAERRGLAGPALRWLPQDAATEGWALETGGYVAAAQAQQRRTPARRAADAAARGAATPAASATPAPDRATLAACVSAPAP